MFRKTRVYKRKRANKLAKKELLKCSLVALLIGAIGTGGSVAWFTSHAKVTSNLNVTTGDINVEVLDRLNNPTKTDVIKIVGLHPLSNKTSNISGSSDFNIKNIGDLNQKVNLSFNSENKDTKFLEGLDYTIRYNAKDIKIQPQNGTMNELITNKVKLSPKDENGNDITLKKGDIVKCTFQVSLNSKINREDSGKSVNFNLTVEANQVNKK